MKTHFIPLNKIYSILKPISRQRNILASTLAGKKFFIILFAIFAFCLVSFVLSRARKPKVLPVPLSIRTFALGTVQPTSYVRSIQYPMLYSSSRIQKLFVNENDFVRKGAPLFVVEDADEAISNTLSSRSLVQEQIAKLRGAEAKLLSTKALRDFYKNQLDRYSFLAKRGAATLEQADEKLTLFNAAQQEYDANIQFVRASRSSLNSAIWQYRSNNYKSSISTVRAPADVRVFKIYSRPGESIQDGKPVMDVGESNSMGVLAQVHKTDIRNVRMGQFVTVTANGIPNLRWKGYVINIGRQISQQSVVSDDPAATVGNQVFNVLIQLEQKYSSQAQNHNLMEVNILFEP